MEKFIKQAPESEITVGVLRNREERQRLAIKKGHNLPSFSRILEHVDMDTMGLDEQSVIVECNRVAFWKFSLPCMIASSGLTLLMFEKGLLQSRPSASYPRLPKIFLAALVGYTGGQVLYAYSQDCSRRLLVKAPGGIAAKMIRLQTGAETEKDFTEADHAIGQEESQDFILPSDTVIERLDLIRKQL